MCREGCGATDAFFFALSPTFSRLALRGLNGVAGLIAVPKCPQERPQHTALWFVKTRLMGDLSLRFAPRSGGATVWTGWALAPSEGWRLTRTLEREMVDRSTDRGAPSRSISRARLRCAGDNRLVGYVRRGDSLAFEVLYDRYSRELLSFCRYMLGSQADAEDAVQRTFVSAHRALLADDRAVELRPWLFAIARNASRSILRKRPPTDPFDEGRESFEDPVEHLEQREALRQAAAGLRLLPERQRAALVLTQVYGFTLTEVSAFLGVRPEQVKAYVYQARTNLIAERDALSVDCRDIREELATARGPALRKSHLRRHLRSCEGCREYARQAARVPRQLGALLPVAPSLALKRSILQEALGGGSTSAAGSGAATAPALAAATELAGAGAKTLIAKVLVGITCVAASGTGALVVGGPIVGLGTSAAAAGEHSHAQLVADGTGPARGHAVPTRIEPASTPQSAPAPATPLVARPVVAPPQSVAAPSSGGPAREAGMHPEPHGKSEEPHGANTEAPHGKSEEPHGANTEAPHGKSEEPHGANTEAPHGKSEEPHGANTEAPHGKSEEPQGKGSEGSGGGVERGRSQEAHSTAAREKNSPTP